MEPIVQLVLRLMGATAHEYGDGGNSHSHTNNSDVPNPAPSHSEVTIA